MEQQKFESLNEVLYQEILSNRLKVTLLPKKEYHKTYGIFTTNYGSIDNSFIPLGSNQRTTVPDGIAHFLEHKMFEKEDGDVFQLFGKLGAQANAFTSFTRTSYLFSSTSHTLENTEVLLDFVQSPYFTEETVEKEKGIIGQEIQMYQDEPNWRLFFGILGNLYPKHPLHIDIAGTVESIAEITAEDLYTCYHTFYHPSNMNLFLVGNFEPDEIMKTVRNNQDKKTFDKPKKIERFFPEEDVSDIVKHSELRMAVQRPKAIIGIKGVDTVASFGRDKSIYEVSVSLLLQLLFGPTSETYLRLYNEGIIDDSFGFEFNFERSFHFADISCDTDQPERFVEAIKHILLNAKNSEALTEENLSLLKKRLIGKHLLSLNSLESIANQFSQLQENDITPFDSASIIESIQLENIYHIIDAFIREDCMTTFFILPKED